MLLEEIRTMNLNVDGKFTLIQQQMTDLTAELSQMKLEMCTRQQFEQLESRVHQLEINVASTDNPDMKFLQTQLDKLDPANKSVVIFPFKSNDGAERVRIIESIFASKFPGIAKNIVVEHVFKGPFHDRTMTPMSIVELPLKSQRDTVLKSVKDGTAVFTEAGISLKSTFPKTKKIIAS